MQHPLSAPGTHRPCPHCGASQSLQALFCTACGQPLARCWQLRVQQTPPHIIALTTAPVSIGRLPESTLCVADPHVSRTHARIVWDGQTFVLSDLGSSSGTFLNHVRLTAPTALHLGDQIQVGDVVTVQVEEGAAQRSGNVVASPPKIVAPPVAPQPQRAARRWRGGGRALIVLAVLGVLLVSMGFSALPWLSQFRNFFGLTPATSSLAVPALPLLPDATVEGPAIKATLVDLAAALRAGNVAAAAEHFTPEVRADYQALFAAHPERLAAMAAPLEAGVLSLLAPSATAEDGRRCAEVTVQVDGITFAITLVKDHDRWLVKLL